MKKRLKEIHPGASSSDQPIGPLEGRRERVRVWLPVLLLTLVLDHGTKLWAIDTLRQRPMQSFLGDLFRLEYSENIGAFLSFGAQLPDPWRFYLLTILVGVFVLGLWAYLIATPLLPRIQLWGLALVGSGGFSNLIDRVFRPRGAVVDFMNMGVGSLRTGIFNIADMAIMAGIGLLLWTSFRESHTSEK